MRVNPILEGYAFIDGGFTWGTDNIGFKVDSYFQPLTTHLIELDAWKSVNYPDWWTSYGNESIIGDCFGARTTMKPVHT